MLSCSGRMSLAARRAALLISMPPPDSASASILLLLGPPQNGFIARMRTLLEILTVLLPVEA